MTSNVGPVLTDLAERINAEHDKAESKGGVTGNDNFA